MTALSRDTDVSAEEVLVRLLRQAPVHRHLEIVSSLVRTTRRLSWQGMCELHPDESAQALARRFFSYLYPGLPYPENAGKVPLPKNEE